MASTIHTLIPAGQSRTQDDILIEGEAQFRHATNRTGWVTHNITGDVRFESVDDLEEFSSTDLSHLFTQPQLNTRSQIPRGLIPQPHLLPCPPVIRSPPSGLFELPEHPITKVLAIDVQAALRPPTFSRAAWIVPVQGQPRFEGTTPAVFSTSKPERLQKGFVTWTSPSLLEFWSLLVKAQRDNKFGPLGLSFVRAHHDGEYDYIKIYHDRVHSMRIRAVLHSVVGTQETKRRVLKGALLALVDELGNGLLLS